MDEPVLTIRYIGAILEAVSSTVVEVKKFFRFLKEALGLHYHIDGQHVYTHSLTREDDFKTERKRCRKALKGATLQEDWNQRNTA